MNESAESSWGQTAGAILTSLVVFLLLIYIVAPIVEWVFNLYGRFFVPARFGGGSEVDSPGLMQIALRAILMSGASAYGALAAARTAFQRADMRIVAASFAVAVLMVVGLVLYAGFESGEFVAPVVVIALLAAPSLVVAYWFARDEF